MILESIPPPSWVSLLGWTLIHFLWQGAAVASLLLLTLLLLRRATANARYLAACAALLAVAAAPPLTLYTQLSQPTALTFAEQATSRFSIINPSSLLLASPNAASAGESKFGTMPRAPWLPVVVTGWGLGVAFLSLRILGGWLQVERLKRCGTRPITGKLRARAQEMARRLRITRPVVLLESASVQVPMVLGGLRSVILIPASALSGLPVRQIEALLAHELAHIHRGDYLVNLLQTAIETLLFYHPAVWWISARIRAERENCCDDLAVRMIGDRVTYLRALTSLEELRGAAVAPLALAGNGGDLLLRIRRLLGMPGPPAGAAPAGLLALLPATLFLTLAALQLHVWSSDVPVRDEDGRAPRPASSAHASKAAAPKAPALPSPTRRQAAASLAPAARSPQRPRERGHGLQPAPSQRVAARAVAHYKIRPVISAVPVVLPQPKPAERAVETPDNANASSTERDAPDAEVIPAMAIARTNDAVTIAQTIPAHFTNEAAVSHVVAVTSAPAPCQENGIPDNATSILVADADSTSENGGLSRQEQTELAEQMEYLSQEQRRGKVRVSVRAREAAEWAVAERNVQDMLDGLHQKEAQRTFEVLVADALRDDARRSQNVRIWLRSRHDHPAPPDESEMAAEYDLEEDAPAEETIFAAPPEASPAPSVADPAKQPAATLHLLLAPPDPSFWQGIPLGVEATL